MTVAEILALVLGSAAVGAFVSSIVSGIFNGKLKSEEMERRDMEMALKMAELKHQQMMAVFKYNADPGIVFFDPLMSIIEYHKGMKQYRQTGRWKKGEAGHQEVSITDVRLEP